MRGPYAWIAVGLVLWTATARAGLYVTETSGLRWNDVAGVRWNDASGLRWSDAAGLRWNEVGGVRWSDAAGLLFSDALGVRWSDAAGLRWNDASGLEFTDPATGSEVSIDLELLNALSVLPDSSTINVIITYSSAPTSSDFLALTALGISGGTVFRQLPMVVIDATKQQIEFIATFQNVRSIYADRTLSLFDAESRALIGADEVAADPYLRTGAGAPFTGAGVTIATLDTGVDATHPDLPYGSKVVENVRLSTGTGAGVGFHHPSFVEGTPNTDLVLGHGTFVASVAAGTGAASSGQYRGVAPGASILALSAGDVFIMNMLEGFDYILENRTRFGVRVVNCSWGTNGWFDPDDPVNIATRTLYDRGITVVFAAGNEGPSPDSLNPYSVAPWVIGVGSVRRDGRLSEFSSRGIFEELLYHPLLVAPGEGIIAASPVALSGVNGIVGVADPPAGVTVPPEHAAYYTVSSGTSFAAPHVAGVVALLLEARPDLTPAKIRQLLQKTATPMLENDRSESGAGRLDLWAALTQARHPLLPFGTHVAGWLDERAFRIEQIDPVESEHFLPAGGTVAIPVTAPEGALSWQMTLAWGNAAGSDDLDVAVRNGAGEVVAASEAINGTALYGRTEGVHLLGSVPPQMTVEVAFKGGQSLAGQTFYMRQETAVSESTYPDVEGLPAESRAVVDAAVGRRVMIGRGSSFEPDGELTRGELARSLALVAGVPQRVPSKPSFADTSFSDLDLPYVETVAGARARPRLMEPIAPGRFDPHQAVSRLDFAVSSVRAAGRSSEADARAGEGLGLLDEGEIPAELRGYVAVALEQGLIEAVSGDGGSKLYGGAPLSRLDAARWLLALLDAAQGPLVESGAALEVPTLQARPRDSQIRRSWQGSSSRSLTERAVSRERASGPIAPSPR